MIAPLLCGKKVPQYFPSSGVGVGFVFDFRLRVFFKEFGHYDFYEEKTTQTDSYSTYVFCMLYFSLMRKNY